MIRLKNTDTKMQIKRNIVIFNLKTCNDTDNN